MEKIKIQGLRQNVKKSTKKKQKKITKTKTTIIKN
jgi:hypothetical protein